MKVAGQAAPGRMLAGRGCVDTSLPHVAEAFRTDESSGRFLSVIQRYLGVPDDLSTLTVYRLPISSASLKTKLGVLLVSLQSSLEVRLATVSSWVLHPEAAI